MKRTHLLGVVAALGLTFVVGGADAPKAMSEKDKIEALIKAVAEMKDAKFVRNGTEYDGKAAADHMRRKWKKVEGEVKTARDFIRLAGTKSYETGQVYKVRFKDGKEVESATFLLEKLAEIEKAAAPATK